MKNIKIVILCVKNVCNKRNTVTTIRSQSYIKKKKKNMVLENPWFLRTNFFRSLLHKTKFNAIMDKAAIFKRMNE